MRVLELPAGLDSREQGRAHGEAFRPLIEECAEIRIELCVRNGRFRSVEDVLAASALHLPLLDRFSVHASEELRGIAEGAGLSTARIVALNHYTDLRDLDPATLEARGLAAPTSPASEEDDDECSLVYARTPEGVLIGETWDTHATATPYVMMLRTPEHEGAPEAWIFTITGNLAIAGVNAAGVGIGVNNLNSEDARVGVVWPAVVREGLRAHSAEAARDVILGAPLGSGHHYFVASEEAAFGIETSGLRKQVVFEGGESFVHTNHCLDAFVGEASKVKATSTTQLRFDALQRGLELAPIESRADLWARLGSHEGYPRGVCTHLAHPEAPHAVNTCGAIVMNLSRRDAWATRGCVHHSRPHHFEFERS
ncbi:MAG: C45 family peptidase [Myxococcales bacterium]|nr:C45 family peptidase [Myxococcales bacterium]